MTTNYQEIMKKAARDKGAAELRLQASNLMHSAACMADDKDLEVKSRQEIHALQDIILDNTAMMYHCANKITNS